MMEVPIPYSWPSSCPKQQAADDDPDDSDDCLLSHEALQAWVAALSCELEMVLGRCIHRTWLHSSIQTAAAAAACFAGEKGHLAIPADSLLLLPAQLPYEMLGPCVLAAVDNAARQQQDQQQLGLQLCGIDLQEPVCGPLLTCFQAYPTLQRLGLRELNVDSHAAGTLANMWRSHHTGRSNSSSVSGLKVLSLQAVFMCQLAWQRVAQGIMGGACQLQTLR